MIMTNNNLNTNVSGEITAEQIKHIERLLSQHSDSITETWHTKIHSPEQIMQMKEVFRRALLGETEVHDLNKSLSDEQIRYAEKILSRYPDHATEIYSVDDVDPTKKAETIQAFK